MEASVKSQAQESDRTMHDMGWRINRSGRLRMVSHRLCLHLALNQRDRVRHDLAEFASTYRALTEGSPQDGVGVLGSGTARAMLSDSRGELAGPIGGFLGHAEALSAMEVVDPDRLAALAELTSHPLLAGLNRLVEAFQNDLDRWSEARRGQIGTLIDQIEDLGSRLHVISINSRIVSARMGAAGRVFRVVNDELQSLGASTAASAQQLRKLQE